MKRICNKCGGKEGEEGIEFYGRKDATSGRSSCVKCYRAYHQERKLRKKKEAELYKFIG